MGARLDSVYPCFPVSLLYFLFNLEIESAQGGVCGAGGAEGVTSLDESEGIVGKVRDKVGDVSSRDVVLGSSQEGSAELGFSGTTGRGNIQ